MDNQEAAIALLELRLSKLLATGVSLSGVLLLVGIAWLLVTHRTGYPPEALELSRVHPDAFPHTIPQLVTGVEAAKPLAIMALGLLCLVLTPVFRVAASIVLFLLQRDYLYTVICSFVLGMLVVGMVFGAGG